MTKDLNRVQLLGHLGGNPDLRTLDTGQTLATFSVATSRRWKDSSGQEQEETEWSRVVTWGKLAELVGQYLQQGARVYLEGRLKTRIWDDPETAERRRITEVVADELILLDGRRIDERESVERTQDTTPASDVAEADNGGRHRRRPASELAPGINPRPRLVQSEARRRDPDDADGDFPI